MKTYKTIVSIDALYAMSNRGVKVPENTKFTVKREPGAWLTCNMNGKPAFEVGNLRFAQLVQAGYVVEVD